jgi:hypothetical protein
MCIGPFQASRDRWIAACGDSSTPHVRVRIDNYTFNVAECVVQAALDAPHQVPPAQKLVVRDGSQVQPVVCFAKETLDSTMWASFTETTA